MAPLKLNDFDDDGAPISISDHFLHFLFMEIPVTSSHICFLYTRSINLVGITNLEFDTTKIEYSTSIEHVLNVYV